MARKLKNWIDAYVTYASFGEAPAAMSFWCGVSALAGALRRKVWIDQAYFKWYTNCYIILVAPPGIVSKSTTAGVAMNLLKQVPGIKFGPDVVTWPALVQAFAASSEMFQQGEAWHTMSALTIESSEFGNLLNPQDKQMVDLLVALWDGKQGAFQKMTKMSGNDTIENPWINLLACTTPSWIAGNFPEYMIGGGFTSRCLFVYAEQKAKYVAYPGLVVPGDLKEVEAALVHDLEYISCNLCGEYKLNEEAVQWGEMWYEDLWKNKPALLDDERFGGYIARKQTHIHKLSMILAAAASDNLIITKENLELANCMVTDLETSMPDVFAKIGKSEQSVQADRFINYIKKNGLVQYDMAYRFIHAAFPDCKDFEGILSGAVRAGYVQVVNHSGGIYVKYCDKLG